MKEKMGMKKKSFKQISKFDDSGSQHPKKVA
jgi:hypothetical protein